MRCCKSCPFFACSLLNVCILSQSPALAETVSHATRHPIITKQFPDSQAQKVTDLADTHGIYFRNPFGSDKDAFKRPIGSPLPPDGVPKNPWAGDPNASITRDNPYEKSPHEKYKGHFDTLDALTDGEAFSSLLNPNLDAQRYEDLEDPYFVQSAGMGHAVPQIMPFRKKLQDKGISFTVFEKGQLLGNFHGGERTGDEYINRVGFNFNFDLGRLFGFRNWSVHAIVMNKRGRPAAMDKVGEYNLPLMQNLKFTGPEGFRLTTLYAEKTFMQNRVNIIFGRMLFGHAFATSPLLCTFMTTCAQPSALKINPNNPRGSWATRIGFRPTRDTDIHVGAFQAFPINQDPSGWYWNHERSNRLVLPIEFVWRPYLTKDRLAGRYKFGFLHSTGGINDIAGSDVKALNMAWKAQGRTGHPQHTHKPGPKENMNAFWFEMEQMMYRFGGRNEMAGGYFLSGFVHNTPHTTLIDDEAYGGLSLNGLIKDRPNDRFGLLYSWFHISDRKRLGERALLQDAQADDLSSALVMGDAYGRFGSLGNKIKGVQSTSQVIEAYYSIDMGPGVVVQPEFLYEIKPGQTHHIPDSAMLGMKAMVNL